MMHGWIINLLTYYTLYSVLVGVSVGQKESVCKTLSECSCQKDDGRIIDITSLGNKDGTPLFKDVESVDGYAYSYNPCGGFSEGVCSNAAACKKDLGSGESLEIGRDVGAQFSYDEQTGETVIIYTAGQLGELHTITYLLCDQSTNPGRPQFYPNGTMDTNLFLTTLFTVCACPGRCDAKGVITPEASMLGIGWIILICVAAIFILYFVIGAVFMKFVKKATGTDIIPNKTTWINLPKNIKNGTVFLFNKCTGKKENYSEMK